MVHATIQLTCNRNECVYTKLYSIYLYKIETIKMLEEIIRNAFIQGHFNIALSVKDQVGKKIKIQKIYVLINNIII
jgi:hypothetical protein